jgi:hypothetical protein
MCFQDAGYCAAGASKQRSPRRRIAIVEPSLTGWRFEGLDFRRWVEMSSFQVLSIALVRTDAFVMWRFPIVSESSVMSIVSS